MRQDPGVNQCFHKKLQLRGKKVGGGTERALAASESVWGTTGSRQVLRSGRRVEVTGCSRVADCGRRVAQGRFLLPVARWCLWCP